jgi:hypothetical protein
VWKVDFAAQATGNNSIVGAAAGREGVPSQKTLLYILVQPNTGLGPSFVTADRDKARAIDSLLNCA